MISAQRPRRWGVGRYLAITALALVVVVALWITFHKDPFDVIFAQIKPGMSGAIVESRFRELNPARVASFQQPTQDPRHSPDHITDTHLHIDRRYIIFDKCYDFVLDKNGRVISKSRVYN